MQPQLMKRMRRLQSKGGGSRADLGMRGFPETALSMSRVWIVVVAVVVEVAGRCGEEREDWRREVTVWAAVSAIPHRRVFVTIIVRRGRAAKVAS